MRLSQLARQLKVAPEKIVTYLSTHKMQIDPKPNAKLPAQQAKTIRDYFAKNPTEKTHNKEINQAFNQRKAFAEPTRIVLEAPPTIGKLMPQKDQSPTRQEAINSTPQIRVLGKIEIPTRKNNRQQVNQFPQDQRRQSRHPIKHHIQTATSPPSPHLFSRSPARPEKKGRRLQATGKFDLTKRKVYREQKQGRHSSRKRGPNSEKVLQVTEFISAHELAPLLNVPVTRLLDICLALGMEVSINQRLNKEAITIIAEELGRKIQFITIEEEIDAEEKKDDPKELQRVAPVVTIMGHVDHGKTSLIDYIRKTKLITQEAGGITQHIGAYDVDMPNGRRMVFLDTPGHEAFTAMRARGSHITHVIIIVVAANDGVMPQTKEAISHAQLAGNPVVIAINKIDHPEADAEKVKSQLSDMNIMVEEWGGKYQCQSISAKTGEGVDELLEKVILEADILDIKANPNKPAKGAIIEALLKKGQGYVATAMVQEGTLRRGDILVAGSYFGKVKSLLNSKNETITEAPPSTPVQVLGLDGAPPAGQVWRVMPTDRNARNLANRYKTILQEQRLSAQHKHTLKKKHATLFSNDKKKSISILLKGDVSGSVEALADALLALTNEEIDIHISHKAVGPVTESDVLFASTSRSIIIAFHTQVNPQATQIQKREKVTIVRYQIIYEAIDHIKKMMEDLKEPTIKEPIVLGKAEVRKIFKISRIGTIAGCHVKEGFIKRNQTIRILRDGEILYDGPIKQLKREKEVIKEAETNTECGISTDGFNDIEVGDMIECMGLET